MNKVVNSYSLNERLVSQQVSPRKTPIYAPSRTEVRAKIAARAERRQKRVLPQWIFFTCVVAITFAFCVIVNVKTRSEMHVELQQQQLLHTEIEQLQNDNSALADEVQRLQSDPATIERAARQRLNMVRANEKVLVSVQ